ncbi:hypothetical protein, partial [Corynebacterium parakroppenstedtii]|uniref:hypothetical protein n=1 Tax=Corynebacterium parakroppenstedtii TaxID=2828363 RepID=UPI0030EC9645
FAPQDSVRTAFCRITHATATTLPSRASNVGNKNAAQRWLYSPAKTTQTNVGNSPTLPQGGHYQ